MVDVQKLSKKTSSQVITLQISELQGSWDKFILKFEQYQKETDKRIRDLEDYKTTQVAIESETDKNKKNSPPLDMTKIVLGLISLIASALVVIQQMSK